ncbi:MAG: PDZ domain-containing protein [Planctomycetota bacterium]|nr:PDZ domain-containing protein [Planctomycetota bacterium]
MSPKFAVTSCALAVATSISGCKSLGFGEWSNPQETSETTATDPVESQQAAPTQPIRPRIDVVFHDGGEEVYIDGDRIPSNHLHRDADGIEILGPDGTVLNRIDLPAPSIADRPSGFIGAQLQWIDPSLASHLGIDPKNVTAVGSVLSRGPAAEAGISPHDLIVGVDGSADAGLDAVRAKLRTASPGSTIAFTIRHGVESREVLVTIGAWRHQPLPSAGIVKPTAQ